MTAFAVGMALVLVVVLVAAAVSDLRDRRSGHDPSMRADGIVRHRQEIRAQRTRDRARRMGWSGDDDSGSPWPGHR